MYACTRGAAPPKGFRLRGILGEPTAAAPLAREEERYERRNADDGRARGAQGWPGVSKETHTGGRSRDGFRVPPATIYRFGRRHIGHIHDTGVADITLPRELHDALISEGKAKPHPAGFKAVVSYYIRRPEDVPGAVQLFRMTYEHTKAAAQRRTRTAPPSSDTESEGLLIRRPEGADKRSPQWRSVLRFARRGYG